jgi:hypothetical protein
MISHKTIRVSCLLAGTLLFSASAFADGAGEVAGFGGGTAITGGGVNPLVGGSAGYQVIDHLQIFGEFSVAPLASVAAAAASQASALTGVSVTAKETLYNYGGGMDFSFGSSKKVVPYVVMAVGVGHFSASATATVGGVSGSGSASSNSVYLGAGGGVRIYAGDHWGIKPEFRYQRYTDSGGGLNSANFTVGLFYQFGK